MSAADDLLIHLVARPIEVDFLGTTFTIPARDALGWLELIIDLDPWQVFPVQAGQRAVDETIEALWSGQVEIEELTKIAMEVISVAADRPWWEALRIIHVAKDAWDIVHVHQVNDRPLAGWLDEVWSRILQHCDPKKRASFIGQVTEVPKGWADDVDFSGEERAFMAAMNAVMR